MAHIQITLQAGKAKRQTFGPVQFLTIADLGAAVSVDVDIEVEKMARESLRGLRIRDRIRVPGTFTSAVFTAAVDCTIEVIASVVDVQLNNQEGAAVDATVVGPFPLSVQTTRGNAPAAPLYVSGQVLGDTPCGTVTDDAPIAVPAATPTDILAADATRLEAVIFNQGPDPVAIGMPGLTWEKRAIVLNAGDCWIESRAAAKAWAAITDAGTTATVAVQERKS